MDQVERANIEHPVVACRLQEGLSDSGQQRQLYEISDVSTWSFRLLFAVWFLKFNLSQIPDWHSCI
jgi:hypothetical protein